MNARRHDQIDVFVSYRNSENELASAIVSELRRVGYKVFWDRDIPPGKVWDNVLDAALDAAKHVIVVWTSGALSSPFILAEAKRAQHHSKYIGIIAGVESNQLPLFVQDADHLVLGSGQNAVSRLIELLLVRLGFVESMPSSDAGAIDANKGFAFISHVEEDLDFVGRLIEYLRRNKYGYWSYKDSHRNRQKPTHWEIEDRLLEAEMVLVVVSPPWKQSEWAFRELAFSREVRKPLFLLRAEDPGPTLAIAGDTYVDFVGDEAAGFLELDKELRQRGII